MALIMLCYICIVQNNLTDLRTHVNNKISHACKSKVTSCGNVRSHGNTTSFGNSLSHLVEVIIFMANFGILHTIYCVLPHMSTHVK